jgi:hypothetical protein
MFNGFKAYDDEGYFLITVTDYVSGHPLFTQALPIFGPFYSEIMGGLFKLLGLAPGHDNGRSLTLVVWLMASLAGGLASFWLTRNAWLGLAAEFVTFRALTALVSEPMHPSGLAALLLVGLVGAAACRAGRPRATAAVIGALVGALCLIKINVGGFAAIAVAFAWAGSLPHPWRRVLLPFMAVLMAVLPLVLMAGRLSDSWALEFAVLEVLSAAAVGVACVMATPRPLPVPAAKWLSIGGAVLVIASVGIAVAGGTALENLVSGTFLKPLRLPQLFAVPPTIGVGNDLWAAFWLVAAIAICGPFARGGSIPAAGLVRVFAGFTIWLAVIFLPSSMFLLGLPLAWIATQAPGDGKPNSAIAYFRLFVPALAVLESLQAYPVAGPEQSIAALGLVPLGAIILNDGIRQLQANAARRKAAVSIAPAAFVISFGSFLLFGYVAMVGFASAAPLGLHGAESVRVPAKQGAQLRALVASIDRVCPSFITYPGMDSFYLWTAQEPPAEVSSQVWWLVLTNQEQQSLVNQLEPIQRLCVVKNQRVIDMYAQGREVPKRPLVDYIDKQFVRAYSYGDYELLVRVNQP